MPKPEPDDLRALGSRLDEVHRRKAVKASHEPPSTAGIAWRFTSELVAALIVGGGIGWGLDYVFHTRPLFLIVFFVAGAIVGIRNVMSAAKQLNAAAAAGASAPSEAAGEEDE